MIMHFEPTSVEYRQQMKIWDQVSRLAERTCRPIVDGRRIPRSPEMIDWTFFLTNPETDEHGAIASPVPIGRVTCFDINERNRSAEFGYIVHPNFRRQGVSTQMLRMSIARLFETLDLNKLYCQTGAFNTASIKLLEKLGFHRDAVLRQHHELDGKLWDDYIYSLLRCEANLGVAN
jgi:[ribosomal protein S5]-alanine N-acetyltransferase